MTAWSSGELDISGLRVHYTRTGGGDKPPVVLAHGGTDDGPCWTAIARVLGDEFDVIMPDARGHGRSDAPDQGYGSAQQAADLAGVIRALGLTRPAVLGHSMGAASALVLAGTYPDLPGAILLEDPPSWWMPATSDDEEEAARRRAAMVARFTALKRQTRAELLAGIRHEQPQWSDVEVETWVDAKQRFSPNMLRLLGPEWGAAIDWTPTLRRITCPVTLITADPARGAIVTAEAAEALRQVIPQVRIAHIPGAGHNIRRDQPARFLEVVRGALAAWAAGRV